MAKQPDDNLERFFLNRIDDYKIDYREEDWIILNEMLDAADTMKAAALRQKIIWVGSGALLVISILLLLWMSQNLTGKQIEASTTQIKAEAVEDINNSPNDRREGNSESENQVQVMENESQNNKNSKKRDAYITTMDNSSNKEGDEESKSISDKIKLDGSLNGTIPVRKSSVSNTVTEPIIIMENQNDLQEAVSINISPSGPNVAFVNANRFTLSSDLRQSSGTHGLRKNYAWNFSLAADNSAVGMSDFTGPMLRAGLSAEYYFSTRTSIMAGVNYSVKEYTAFGNEYKVAYGNGGVSPDEAFGTCNVLDIPIDFTYYIQNKKGQSFFLRSGISSWLMLEEHYYFSYDSNDPDLVRYWGGENENYHFFSIFNLSGGFEYPLNPKFSIMAEPYLNVPLGGVGYGSVKLYSAGIRVVLKINHYKLVSGK